MLKCLQDLTTMKVIFFKHCYPSIQNCYFSFKSSITLLPCLDEYSSKPLCEEKKWEAISWLDDIKGHRLNSGTVQRNASSWEIKDIQNI